MYRYKDVEAFAFKLRKNKQTQIHKRGVKHVQEIREGTIFPLHFSPKLENHFPPHFCNGIFFLCKRNRNTCHYKKCFHWNTYGEESFLDLIDVNQIWILITVFCCIFRFSIVREIQIQNFINYWKQIQIIFIQNIQT